METLHDQLKNYIPKLEKSIISYMGSTPPTPNSAQGITAMVTCLELLKNAMSSTCAEFDRDTAEKWAAELRNTDGTSGAHWSVDQTTAVAEDLGVAWDKVTPWCWWIAMNMVYSDYYGVAAHFGVATPEFFGELARAFLFDEDAPPAKEKLAAYYCGIVKAGS